MLVYSSFLFFFILSLIVACVMVFGSYILSTNNPVSGDLLSAYECGFNPYGDARQKFEVRFFLVGILFIIFDLEITFIFPWSSAQVGDLASLSIFSFWTLYTFLIILTGGLVYEYRASALDWE